MNAIEKMHAESNARPAGVSLQRNHFSGRNEEEEVISAFRRRVDSFESMREDTCNVDIREETISGAIRRFRRESIEKARWWFTSEVKAIIALVVIALLIIFLIFMAIFNYTNFKKADPGLDTNKATENRNSAFEMVNGPFLIVDPRDAVLEMN